MYTPAENVQTPAQERNPRKHLRSLFSVPLHLHQLKGPGLCRIRGISLDISEGGLGALVEGKLSVGETVLIDLPLGIRMLSTMATVRHTSIVRSGFEFLRLNDGDRRQIATLIGTT